MRKILTGSIAVGVVLILFLVVLWYKKDTRFLNVTKQTYSELGMSTKTTQSEDFAVIIKNSQPLIDGDETYLKKYFDAYVLPENKSIMLLRGKYEPWTCIFYINKKQISGHCLTSKNKIDFN